jgi:quercetin dioxygenase-like cupin family protein
MLHHIDKGEIMFFRTAAMSPLIVAGFLASATAQTTSPPAITRSVIASAKLPTVTDAPMFFKAASVTLLPDQQSNTSAPTGIVYQVSGSTEVLVGGDAKLLKAGEGMFIPGGTTASLKDASRSESILLQFILTPATELDQPSVMPPAMVRELYRTTAPIPDLKAGIYDMNLTRVTFPPGMPSNAPHHRSGAALYYIVSGTGANTVDGKTDEKGAGSLIYEPYDLVHQWGNPGAEPMTFLAFNINPEGVAAVLPGAPPKTQ